MEAILKFKINKSILRQLEWNKNLSHIQKYTILSKTDYLRFGILMEIVPFSSDSEFLRVLVNIGLNEIEKYLIENKPEYHDKFVKNLSKEYKLEFRKAREGYISFDEMFNFVFKSPNKDKLKQKVESDSYKKLKKNYGKKFADFIHFKE